ncbi:MAG: hypothetical protein KBT63_11075 [Porticoccaceae bacterium]|nr:hypothetical protein [Porticoccaceae bacterium]
MKKTLIAPLVTLLLAMIMSVSAALADEVTVQALLDAGLELTEVQQAEILAAEGDALVVAIDALLEGATPEDRLLITETLSSPTFCDRTAVVGGPFICDKFAHLRSPPTESNNNSASPN